MVAAVHDLKLTLAQEKARRLLAGPDHVLLFGGSRSGKTWTIIRRILINAMRTNCRQFIFRSTFNAVRTSIGMDTIPTILEQMGIGGEKVFHLNKTSWVYTCKQTGSEIWLLGLDSKERTDKVLGKQCATIYFNECSEMSYESVETVLSRLAQNIVDPATGRLRLKNRVYYDCNPPSKNHWAYRAFILKQNPISRVAWEYPDDHAWLSMNPHDNIENLPPGYIDKILGSMSPKKRKRFLDGEWADDAENALWKRPMIDTFRVNAMPNDLEKIFVGVDPSGGDTPSAAECGIVVAGMKRDIDRKMHYYVIDDKSIKGPPEVWGSAVIHAYNHYGANMIVAENNFGGDMVERVIRSVEGGERAGYKAVRASTGKIARAEPISTKYARGQVSHVGSLPELEDEMCTFTGLPDVSEKSPNRLDAMVWALTLLSEYEPAEVVESFPVW